MSKFATLLHGQSDDVMDILEHQQCSADELRAALTNAFRRIKSLEESSKRHETKKDRGCPKCFGSGGKRSDPCSNCNGTWRVPK